MKPRPGLHPVILFKDYGDPPSLIQASVTFPAGWTITEDADYSNNGELARGPTGRVFATGGCHAEWHDVRTSSPAMVAIRSRLS